MDFGSIRRKNRVSQPSRRKTFSASNLSCISCNSASIGRKTVCVTLPKDGFGCEVNLDGKIVHIRKGGAAHTVGVLQIGDYLRIVDDDCDSNDELVKLQVTYGVLQVDARPDCPLVIEIGNRSHTSLGIALADGPDNKILISSIQPGSLADRCGFIQCGDVLTSVQTNENESIPCSYYNSYQVAQILRQLTSKSPSVKLTIVPFSDESNSNCPNLGFFQSLPRPHRNSSEDIDIHSGGSNSTLTLGDDSPNFPGTCHPSSISISNTSSFSGVLKPPNLKQNLHKRQISKVEELDEEQANGSHGCVLSMCLWKDPLYEDWGFSLLDQSETETDAEVELEVEVEGDSDAEVQKKLIEEQIPNKSKSSAAGYSGAIVYQIRPGGPAYNAGLKPGDRIIEINGRDVSQLESTHLVPILASLDEALNIMILRMLEPDP